MTDIKAGSPELGWLEPFVGAWETTGQVLNAPSGPPAGFTATDTYEWVAGGQFLLHRFDANMPNGTVTGIEIIGYSQETHSYLMYSFDNSGGVTVMQGHVEKGRWSFLGERIRFSGAFRDDNSVFGGSWEIRSAEETGWQPLMHVQLSKVKQK